jgi:hypothetical protein
MWKTPRYHNLRKPQSQMGGGDTGGIMSRTDIFKTYSQVTLGVGFGFEFCGVWNFREFMTHELRTVAGSILFVVIFVLLPLSVGGAIIPNQLRLRRKSN